MRKPQQHWSVLCRQLASSAAVLSLASLVGLPAVHATTAQAGEKQGSNSVLRDAAAMDERVRTLLDVAVKHVQEKGIIGVNDFNDDPRFTDKELYLFSLSRAGYILSSGGWSASLIGQNVVNLTDEQGRPFFQQMLDQAATADHGSVEYLWFNPLEGGPAPKITHFRVVGDVLIASGYAPEVSTEAQAKTLLQLAVKEYKHNPELALRKFRNKHSEFRNLDQYVFVLNKAERTLIWNPLSPELNGQPFDSVVDIHNTHFLADIADTATADAIQQTEYWWFSPLTNQVERRKAFYQLVENHVIAVGTFVLPEP